MKTESLVLTKPGRVEITEVDVPDPGWGELLVEVKANGICKGDIALFTGDMSYGYPFYHGHEPSGVVLAVGPGVTRFSPGDPVACLASPSYRKHIIVHESRAAKIPDPSPDFPLWISEPAACAAHGVNASGFLLGDKVALFGVGYMGMLVLQCMPRETFSRLLVIDPDRSRLQLARFFGVTETHTPDEIDLQKLFQETGGFDVVVEASGVSGAIAAATRLVRVGGCLNIFGWHPGEQLIPTHDWHYKGLRVLNTSPMFAIDFNMHFRSAIALMSSGRITQKDLITHRHPYTDADKAFEAAAKKQNGYIKGVITF